MTLQPTQIHDDGVGTAGRRTAKPHIPDSIGNAERSMADSFARQQEKNKENHRNAVFPVIVRIKHAKQVKNRRKKNNTTTTRRYIACACSTVHAADGKPPVLITASAERHRCSGRCPQKATVIIKAHCKTQGKRNCVRTAKEEGHESNKIAKARAKTSDDRYTRSG